MNKTKMKRVLAGASVAALSLGATTGALAVDKGWVLTNPGSTTLNDPDMTPMGAFLVAILSLDWIGAHLDVTQGGGGAYDAALTIQCADGTENTTTNSGTPWDADLDAFCNFGVAGTSAHGMIDDLP